MSIRRYFDSILDGIEKVLTLSFAGASSPGINVTSSLGNKYTVRVNGGAEIYSTGSGFYAASASGPNSLVLSLVDTRAVSYLSFVNFGYGFLTTGTTGAGNACDFSMFPNLATFSCTNSPMNPLTVKADSVLHGGLGAGAAIDASGIDCITFETTNNATSLTFPISTRLQRLNLNNNRFASFTVPAGYNALTDIRLGDGASSGNNGGGPALGTANLSGAANLTTLYANDTAALTFVFPTGFAATCLTLDCNRTRLGNTVFGGSFEAVRAMLAANTAATTLRFRQAGLSGAEQTALITALWTNRASRPAAVALSLDTNSVPLCYPQNSGGLFGTRYNAGIVDAATRAKVADLRTKGWTVAYNAPTLRIATSATAGQLTLTYEGDVNIDIWTAGTVIRHTVAQAGGFLPTGNYTVVSGAGKVWEITGSFATAPGATVVRGTFDI